MKRMKRILIAGGAVLLGLFLVLAAALLVYVQESIRAEQRMEDSQSGDYDIDLGNLPGWITVEMVSAAIDMMNETGYPASVVLGQMILESGAAGSELANPPYYNCLGQKSPSYLETGSVTMNTAEAWGYEDAAFSTFASYVDCMRAWGHKFTMPPYVDFQTASINALAS